MDEAATTCALDLSNRPFLVYEVNVSGKVGDFDVELVEEFFHAVAGNAGLTVHIIQDRGRNKHHILEASFKAFAGFVASLPVIFWQLWLFLAPGLYDHEKKLVIPFVFFATLMFLSGASFAYYIVVPIGFEFLIAFGSNVVTVLPSIGAYVGFFTKLLIGFGISFELPVITFFLAKIGLVDDRMLKDFFRYAIVLIFIIAALLTPPDVVSQLLMAAPLTLLYGISIYIAKVFNPATKEEDEEE